MGARGEIALAIRDYLRELEDLGRKPGTIAHVASGLRRFARALARRGVTRTFEIASEPVRLAAALVLGRPLAPSTRANELFAIRRFTLWLGEEGLTLGDAGASLPIPRRVPRPIPRRILDERQVRRLYRATRGRDPRRVRDRALLEVLYSAGARRSEAAALEMGDVDLAEGLLAIRRGKGDKGRVVPLAEKACRTLARYVREARPVLRARIDADAFLLGDRGRPLDRHRLGQKVRAIAARAGVPWPGRHARRRVLIAPPSEEKLERLRAATVGYDPRRVRDRALLGVLYEAGATRREAAALRVGDVDLEAGRLAFGRGRGEQARAVPLAAKTRDTLARYVREARPLLLRREPDLAALFLGDRGRPLDKNRIGEKVAAIGRRAGIRRLAPHALRHAIATHLVRRGASIRAVQLFLGHAEIETTAIYTHLAPRDLRATLERAHPREREKPLRKARRRARKKMTR